MGAGVARMPGGMTGDTPITIHIHARHGIPTYTTGNESGLCEACSQTFTAFRKKKICKDCGRNFCSNCMYQLQTNSDDLNSLCQCKMCQTLISGAFTRSELMNWKIKDLKALLHKRKIDISACREKEDLIDAVFTNFGGNNRNGSQTPRSSQSTATPTSSSQMGSQNNRQTDPSTMRQSNQQQQQQQRLNDQQREQQQQHTQMSGESLLEALRQQLQQEVAENSQRDNQNNDTSQETEAQIIAVQITLDDIKSEKEIDDLSIKQLKKLLLSNFVDYKGCCERWELEQRVKRLWKEDQINKQKAEEVRRAEENPQKTSSVNATVTGNEDDICKICMDSAIDCVLLECGHMVTCTSCGKRLAECPMCRQYVSRAVHIFKS